MADVIIGIAAILAQVERVAREGVSANGSAQRVYAIVNRMRPGISGLRLKSMGEAMCPLGLQAMIDRVEDCLLVCGLKQRIVADGIERQSTKRLAWIGNGRYRAPPLTSSGVQLVV
jgi:hypothetical protein